jgi:anti-sigma regulatory factor (Ser/Thr protein kinase)
METIQEKISLPAQPSRLIELRSFLRRVCNENGIDPSITLRVILATDEAVSNIMEHSRVPEGETIDVALELGDGQIMIEVRDHGIAFDPRTWRKLRPEQIRGLRRGFGLYLIHLIMEQVEYQRTAAGANVLTLFMHCPQQSVLDIVGGQRGR